MLPPPQHLFYFLHKVKVTSNDAFIFKIKIDREKYTMCEGIHQRDEGCGWDHKNFISNQTRVEQEILTLWMPQGKFQC